MSLIEEFRLLDDLQIAKLNSLDKKSQHIAVGIIQRDDKEFSRQLLNKFAETRRVFMIENKLTDNDIISVKKDAFFLTTKCKRTRFGKVHFIIKNTYSSYIRFPELRNLELYYGPNGVDIKGMSDVSVNRHRIYLLDIIKTVISKLEDHDCSVRRYVRRFIDNYKRGELDYEYYLEFNNMSKEQDALGNLQKVIVPLVQIITKEVP